MQFKLCGSSRYKMPLLLIFMHERGPRKSGRKACIRWQEEPQSLNGGDSALPPARAAEKEPQSLPAQVQHGLRQRCKMKMPADSLMLVSANLVLVGLAHVAAWNGIESWPLFPFLVLCVSPILFLLTVAHGVRDMSRRETRSQAIIALLLSVPSALLVLLSYRSRPFP